MYARFYMEGDEGYIFDERADLNSATMDVIERRKPGIYLCLRSVPLFLLRVFPKLDGVDSGPSSCFSHGIDSQSSDRASDGGIESGWALLFCTSQ